MDDFDELDDAMQMASEMLVAEGQSPIDEIPVHIRPGGYAAAVEFAEEDNLQHGKPLSNKDKFHMLERRMERGHRWAAMSDRAIARELGVDHRTIGHWRGRITGGENSPGDPDVRIGADGKAYNVGGIQDSNRQRAQQADPPPRREDQGNLDEDEPAGRWADHPVSDPVDPDPNSSTVRLQWDVYTHLIKAAESLRILRDYERSQELREYAVELHRVWGLSKT